MTENGEDFEQSIPLPAVEEIVREAALSVQKIPTQEGGLVTLLRFITPFKLYTFQLDERGAELLSNAVRPSKVIPATLADLPPGLAAK